MKFRKFIMILGIGSIIALPVTIISCGTSTLGEKGNSSDWIRKTPGVTYGTDQGDSASYSVKVVETWDGSKTHPTDPGYKGHFQNIVWELSDNKPFWKLGEKTSSNFANFTTKGNMNGFSNKISGNLPYLYKYTFNINVDKKAPTFTMATRFAPSPDWFGGESNVSLFDSNAGWATTANYNMKIYSSAVKDARFTKTGKIIQNRQMNNDGDSTTFKPFGFITITKK